MTGGAGGALNVALKSILDPGDEVIYFTPFFPEYYFYTDNHAGISKIIDSNDEFIPDLESFDNSINNKTKAVIINSPNNPSGVVYDKNFYQKFSKILLSWPGVVGTGFLGTKSTPKAHRFRKQILKPISIGEK